MTPSTIDITVIYALPDEQRRFSARVPVGTSVNDAITASGILGWYPEIDLTVHKVGIYGKLVPLNYALDEDQRVEIYRPITADPKAAREKRAQKQQQTTQS